MRKRDTVEEDLMWGPIKEKEIWFKEYGSEGEVHILARVYKYRVFVSQFDTTDVVWGVVGESFHSIEVEAPRYSIERELKTEAEDGIISKIEEMFPGPLSVDTLSQFCRTCGFDFSIHESGPLRDDLINKFEKNRSLLKIDEVCPKSEIHLHR